MVFRPARWAAITFSLTPPISNTLPLNVISPVIPVFLLTAIPVNADTNAVEIAVPADGPSLGTAPSGT